MGIEYKWVDWTFDNDLWAETMTHAIEIHGIHDLAELLEVNETTLSNWAANRWKLQFSWPHMVNFLKVVNLLNLDPRKFWALER